MMHKIGNCQNCGDVIWDGIPYYDTPNGKCCRNCFEDSKK